MLSSSIGTLWTTLSQKGLAARRAYGVYRPYVLCAAGSGLSLPRSLWRDADASNASWIIVLYEVGSAVWDVWLFNNSGFNLFFLARSGTNFAVSFVLITIGLLYIDRGLDPIEEYPGLTELVERHGRVGS